MNYFKGNNLHTIHLGTKMDMTQDNLDNMLGGFWRKPSTLKMLLCDSSRSTDSHEWVKVFKVLCSICHQLFSHKVENIFGWMLCPREFPFIVAPFMGTCFAAIMSDKFLLWNVWAQDCYTECMSYLGWKVSFWRLVDNNHTSIPKTQKQWQRIDR